MAITLNALRNTIITSLFGRRVGLDVNGALIGVAGMRQHVIAATSDTTGTALPNNGFVSVDSSTDNTWTLTAPVPGCQVTLFCSSTSTGTRTITPTNATVNSTLGTLGTTISLTGGGAFISLVGLTTGLWAQVSRSSSAVAFASS